MRISSPARRELILEKAARLFAARHYHEVRIEDIAQEVGVAKGTIYCYFHDKEDLYLALILAGVERLYAEVEEGIAREHEPEAKLLLYVRASIAFFERYPYFLDLVQRIEATGNAQKIAPLAASRQRFFSLVSKMIKEAARARAYRVPDPAFAALALTGMIRQVLRFQPQPWPTDMARSIVNQFLYGLAGPSPVPRRGARCSAP